MENSKKLIDTVKAIELQDVKFYSNFVAKYYNLTGKKLHITFIGSKGYLHGIEFVSEGQEIDNNIIDLMVLKDNVFINEGLIEIYDTTKGVFLKLLKNGKEINYFDYIK